jgi:transposase
MMDDRQTSTLTTEALMKILALDLGKRKTVGCVYDSDTADHRFLTTPTTPGDMHDVVVELDPDRVVFEVGPIAGWLCDLLRTLGVETQVANVAHQAWRWRNNKTKSDRVDAVKLAQLSAMNQLETVHVPERPIRQWRSLIVYRQRIVGRRTSIKNTIRAILDREAIPMPGPGRGWSRPCLAALRALAMPLAGASQEDIWRGQLNLELDALASVEEQLTVIEKKLDQLAADHPGCALLRTIPSVGARLSEALVATIDDPHRFRSAKQIGAYVGLSPRQYQSGSMNRQGRVTGAGPKHLRSLLVEVAWMGLRYNPWMRAVYERALRGSPGRKKIALIAVARRLLVCCWAMLRSGESWRSPDVLC